MSVRTMARVWAYSKHAGSELLVLLAIADFADDDGNAYPAVPTLASKCRMSDRNANHILVALRSSGELEIRHNEGPRGTNRYRIVLGEAEGVKRSSPPKRSKPLKPASPCTPEATVTPEESVTLKPVAGGGEAGSSKPLKPASDEPSVNHQEPPVRARAQRSRAAQSRTTLPAEFRVSEQVSAWAADRGFDRLDAHLEAFKLKAAAKGYTYVDWDAAFKGAIRDDWAGLRKAGRANPMHADDVFEDAL